MQKMNHDRKRIARVAKSVDQYFKLLSSVDRRGIKKLVNWLRKPSTGFVDSPASRTHKRHDCYPGGLIEHSLKMYSILKDLTRKAKLEIPNESTMIIALLHDICKAGIYQFAVKSKRGARFEYKRDDKYPIGHGDKSIIIIQKFIVLTADEIMAIRWHMGPFDPAYSTHDSSIKKAGYEKLVAAAFSADYIAALLIQ